MAYSPIYGNPYNVYGNFQQLPQQVAPQYNAMPAATGTTDERIWVQSAQAAEAYLVAPNAFVRLWDSTQPVFYEKRADATGKPFPMETYEYKRKAAEGSNSAQLTQGKAIDYDEQIKGISERLNVVEKALMKGEKAHAESNDDDSAV